MEWLQPWGDFIRQAERQMQALRDIGARTYSEQILSQPEGVCGDSEESREAGQGFTHDVAPCIGASGRGFERSGETRGQDPVIAVPDIARCLSTSNERIDWETETFVTHSLKGTHEADTAANYRRSGSYLGDVCDPEFDKHYASPRQDFRSGIEITHSLRGEGFDASEDGTGRGTPLVPVLAGTLTSGGNGDRGYSDMVNATLVPIAFSAKDHGADATEDCSPTLRSGDFDTSHANGGVMPAVCYSIQSVNMVREKKQNGIGISDEGVMYTVTGRDQHAVMQHMAVRRLTPRECERLQGWEDDFTKLSDKTADGPRYKCIGNGWANPCLVWIAQQIEAAEATR